MIATIALDRLPVTCIVGVLPHERGHEQQIFLDVRLRIDADEAIRHEEVASTVDYAELAEDLTEYVRHECFRLVESMAAACVRRIMSEHDRVLWAEVTVHKPKAVPAAHDTWAQVECAREDL
jgi:dihydroneopterin aldolase